MDNTLMHPTGHPPCDCRPLQRCIVLGGTGFLGRAIAGQLVQCGCEVRTFSRHCPDDLAAAGVQCHCGDISDRTALREAMRGCQTVFHTIACCDVWGAKEKFMAVNVEGTRNVLECARECGAKRLIYTSSPSVVVGSGDIVDGDESLPYATRFSAWYPATKRLAEEMVLQADGGALRVCALRPHLIWGRRDPHLLPGIARAAANGALRQLGNGENIVSLTHISNAVFGHLTAAIELCGRAVNAGKAYFICDAAPVRLWTWIREYLRLAGLPPLRDGFTGRRTAWCIAALSELAAHLLRSACPPHLTKFMVQQLTQSHSFSWRSAARDFGYHPVTDNSAGLAETLGQTGSTPIGKCMP